VMSVSQSTLTFDKAFRGKYTALASKIDTSHGLMNQLLDREVLTNQQISSIQVLQLGCAVSVRFSNTIILQFGCLNPRINYGILMNAPL